MRQTAPREPTFVPLVALVLAFYAHLFDRVLSGNGGSFTEVTSSAAVQAIALFLLAISVVGLSLRPLYLSRIFAIAWPVFALALLALLSPLWSENPPLSFRRAVSFAAILLVFLSLYTRMADGAFWRALVGFAVLLTVAQSLTLVVPSYAFHSQSDLGVAEHAGRFRGFYFHKNEAARIGLIAFLILAAALPHAKGRSALFLFAMLSMSGLQLYLAQSAKTFLALPAAIAVLWLLSSRLSFAFKTTVLGVAAAIGLGFASSTPGIALAETVLGWFGRGLDLTGRDVLWQIAMQEIEKRPWFGAGLDAGWTDSAKDLLAQIKGTSVVLHHAHNGYLQLVLDLGLVGLAFAVLPPVKLAVDIARLPRARWRAEETAAALFLGTYITLNLAGSYITKSNDLFPLLLLYFCFEVKRQTEREPSPQAPATQPVAA